MIVGLLAQEDRDISKLNENGVYYDITLKRPKTLWEPKCSLIWLFGKRLKYQLGWHRSYRLNVIVQDPVRGAIDFGWPHIVNFTQCPMYLCIDEPFDEVFENFVNSANRMINAAENFDPRRQENREDYSGKSSR